MKYVTKTFGELKVRDIFATKIENSVRPIMYTKIEEQPQTYNDQVWNAYILRSKLKTYFPDDREVFLLESPLGSINGDDDGNSVVWNPDPSSREAVVKRFPDEGGGSDYEVTRMGI